MSKKDISYFQWDKLSGVSLDKDILIEYNLPANSSWMLPQLMAFVNKAFQLSRNEDGRINFIETVKLTGTNVKLGNVTFSDGKPVDIDVLKGIVNFLKYTPRGDVLPKDWKQVDALGSRYSTAVPLILSALKEYRGVKYSEWDWSSKTSDIEILVEKNIAAMAEYFNGWESPWDKAELLAFREEGRMVKSGKNLGSMKTIRATTTITGISDPEFKTLPSLLKTMLCQVWIYHSTARHPLAITNPMDLDNEAEPLVDTETIKARSTTSLVQEGDPW